MRPLDGAKTFVLLTLLFASGSSVLHSARLAFLALLALAASATFGLRCAGVEPQARGPWLAGMALLLALVRGRRDRFARRLVAAASLAAEEAASSSEGPLRGTRRRLQFAAGTAYRALEIAALAPLVHGYWTGWMPYEEPAKVFTLLGTAAGVSSVCGWEPGAAFLCPVYFALAWGKALAAAGTAWPAE